MEVYNEIFGLETLPPYNFVARRPQGLFKTGLISWWLMDLDLLDWILFSADIPNLNYYCKTEWIRKRHRFINLGFPFKKPETSGEPILCLVVPLWVFHILHPMSSELVSVLRNQHNRLFCCEVTHCSTSPQSVIAALVGSHHDWRPDPHPRHSSKKVLT